MKEKEMHQPNHLGHYHRDIVKIVDRKPYHVKICMTCNHTSWISLASYKKYEDHAHLCLICSQIEKEKKIIPYAETHQTGIISIEMELGVGLINGDIGIQIAEDGRIWIYIDGQAFLRFKPGKLVDTYRLTNTTT